MAAALLPLLIALACCPGLLVPFGANPFEFHKAAFLHVSVAAALTGCACSAEAWRAIRGLDGWRRAAVACGALAIVAAAVSASTSEMPALAWWGSTTRAYGALTEAALLGAFVVALIATSRGGVQAIQTAVILGSVVPTIYALGQVLHVNPLAWNVDRLMRPTSTFGNPLFLAGYLVTVWPLALGAAVAASRSTRVKRSGRVTAGALWLLCAAQLVVLVADGSRGPALALVAATGLAAVLLVAVYVRGRALRRLPAAIALAAAIVFAIGAPRMMYEPVSRGPIAAVGDTGAVRLLLWRAAGQGIGANASRMWFGLGSESPSRLLARYADANLPQIEGPDIAPDRAHNDTLDRLAGYGVAGLVLAWAMAVVTLGAALSGLGLLPRTQVVPFVALSAAACAAAAGALTASGGLWALALLMPVAVALAVCGWIVLRPDQVDCSPEVAIAIVAAVAAWFAHVVDVSLSVSTIASSLNGVATMAIAIAAGAPAQAAARVAGAVRPRSTGPAGLCALVGAAVAAAFVVPRESSDVLALRATEVRAADANASIALLRSASRRNPSSAPLLTELGDALMGAGRFTEALDALSLARHIDPFDYHRPRNLAALHRRWAFALPAAERPPHQEEADRWYRETVEAAPDFSALWAEWANLDAERGRMGAAFSKLEHSAALGMTEETENVSDAILHAMGKAIDTASDEQNVSAALKQLGYPALAAFYASRAPKTATR